MASPRLEKHGKKLSTMSVATLEAAIKPDTKKKNHKIRMELAKRSK